ncbi:MAG: hypothetical protein M3170_09285 [Candidatus Dormibacteraeota bacterium]|nr:hypothetical protein [Candidatus Dormibacteraeota bacterium]
MLAYLFIAIAVVGAAIHLFVRRSSLDRARVVEILLAWSLAVLIGANGIVGAFFHVFFPDFTARQIGWATGSPFQFENAMGDLAMGVLGVLCIWIRGRFWLATVIASSIQLIGDAYGHVYQMVVHHNNAPDNVGAILYSDFLFPVAIIALLIAHTWMTQRQTEQREDHRSAAPGAPVGAR